ncbi:MAG: hypothetical protein O9313_02530 [Acetobacteraceae bacterium]|nr:hypothetical protein [Acetobacteraceae bacterium]
MGIGPIRIKRDCAVQTNESVFVPVQADQRATVIAMGGGVAGIDFQGPTDEGLALFEVPHLSGSDTRKMQRINIARVEFQDGPKRSPGRGKFTPLE